MDKMTDDGTLLALGAVGLLAAAGFMSGGWKGKWSGGMQSPVGGFGGQAGAQFHFGSKNQIGQILDSFGYKGKTRAKWKKSLKGLSQAQLDYVHAKAIG